jgi:hypothetical protein
MKRDWPTSENRFRPSAENDTKDRMGILATPAFILNTPISARSRSPRDAAAQQQT